MKKLFLTTEIPGPYRNFHFKVLERILKGKGIILEVLFMSEEDDIRPDSWFDKSLIDYQHSFWPKSTLKIGRRKIYYNPGMIKYILKEKPDYILAGGLWSSITNTLLAFKRSKKTKFIAWLELNSNVLGIDLLPIRWYKKWLIKKCDALAIPGQESIEYLKKVQDLDPSRLRLLYFPNLIDPEDFHPPTDDKQDPIDIRLKYRISTEEKIIFWPARFEAEKGILEFLSLLEAEMLNGWKILLIGQGSLKNKIHTLIHKKRLDPYFLVLDYLDHQLMPAFYRQVDLFLLPSIIDPNPLSVIEALFSGLPLFISNKVGNHNEAIDQNGWKLDLDASNVVKQALIMEALSSSPHDLQQKGKISIQIANEKWGPKNVLLKFAKELNQ